MPSQFGTSRLLRILRPSTSRSEEHTSELQSLRHLVCRLLLGKIHQSGRVWWCRSWLWSFSFASGAGSQQAVSRQSAGSQQAVSRQSAGSQQAVSRQSEKFG